MDRVVESLLIDLAYGNADLSLIELSEEQETLSIPLELVYIGGMLLTHSGRESIEPPYPSDIQEKFKSYCNFYNEHTTSGLSFHSFALSPRIFPSPLHCKLIRNQWKHRLEILEEKRQKSVEELLCAELEAEHAKVSKCNYKKGKKKNKKSQRKFIQPETSPSTCSSKHESLQDLLTQRIPIGHGDAVCDFEGSHSSWIPVQTKTSSKPHISDPKPPTSKVGSLKSEDNATSPNGDDIAKGEQVNVEFAKHQTTHWSRSTKRAFECSEENPLGTLEQQTSADEISNSIGLPNLSGNKFNIRLDELHAAVTQKDRIIQEQRDNFAITIKEEKEKFNSIIQSLQLRLYISETKRKMYESALDQHVKSIAENVCTPTTVVGTPGAPYVDDETRQSKAPLISRVLKHHHSLAQD